MVFGIVKDLFGVFIQSFRLIALFLKEESYGNAACSGSLANQQKKGNGCFRVRIGMSAFAALTIIPLGLVFLFLFHSQQARIFLVIYMGCVIPVALLLVPSDLLDREEYAAVLDKGRDHLDQDDMPDPSIAQEEVHRGKGPLKVAGQIVCFDSLAILIAFAINLNATYDAQEWLGMLYVVIIFALLITILHLHKNDGNMMATIACEMAIIGLCMVAVDDVISHLANYAYPSMLTYVGEIVAWLGAFLLLTSIPIPGGWLDRKVYAPLSLQYWRHVLVENLASSKGIDWDTPVTEWSKDSKEFLKAHVETNRGKRISLNVVSAVVIGLGGVWPQWKKIAVTLFPESDTAVATLLFIIVFAIMQGFRSYYWRHLEAMYRQLKSTQIDDEVPVTAA